MREITLLESAVSDTLSIYSARHAYGGLREAGYVCGWPVRPEICREVPFGMRECDPLPEDMFYILASGRVADHPDQLREHRGYGLYGVGRLARSRHVVKDIGAAIQEPLTRGV